MLPILRRIIATKKYPKTIISNGDFNNETYWAYYKCTHSNIDGRQAFTATAQYGSVYKNIATIVGHKYYICAIIEGTTNNGLFLQDSPYSWVTTPGTPQRVSVLRTASGTTEQLNIITDKAASSWATAYVDKAFVVDVTNRPGTDAEIKAWCDSHLTYENTK